MKDTMKKIWQRFVLAWKELGNLFTNLLCPIMSLLVALAEALQLPTAAIQALKNAEYWCWNACGTKKIIDTFVDSVDKVVEKNTENTNKIEDNTSENGDAKDGE